VTADTDLNVTIDVAIFVTEGVQLLDVAGPLDVLNEANRLSDGKAYRTQVVSTSPGPVMSSSGSRLLPDTTLAEADPTSFDTVLVAGGPGLARRFRDERELEWLRAVSCSSRRFGSICTGAFLLAEAGLLNNRRATTHWAVADELASRFPDIDIEVDAIHVRDGKLRTAAGVTAGLDLSLAFVEEDLGAEIARRVAAQLVMYFRRAGGQLQYSRKGASRPVGRAALQAVQRWVVAHPGKSHRVDELAARSGLSPRHFARLFRQEVGSTPSAWVMDIRLQAAQRLLERGDAPKVVSGLCGFEDVDTFRRAFVRKTGVTPSAYRYAQAETKPSNHD